MGDGLLERLMQKWQLAQEGSVLHSFALQCMQVGDRSFFVAGFVSAASAAGMIASSAINRLTFSPAIEKKEPAVTCRRNEHLR